MSYLKPENGNFVFYDAFNKPQILIDLRNPAVNQSDLPQGLLLQQVNSSLPKLFNGAPDVSLNVMIYLRIIAHLMKKSQVHHVLRIGAWSPLDEVLAETLPKFNPANKLYCYVSHRPVGKFEHVNFIAAEVNGGGLVISENKFATIIFPERKIPPAEILLAAKDWGKIYFIAPSGSLPDFLKPQARAFVFEQNFSLFELEISPNLKQELRRHSAQGQLELKKLQIKEVVAAISHVSKKFNALPPQERNACLDEYIAKVSRVEKILNEIFPDVHSDTIKQNFNMFKEFLIDVRLYDDWQLKKIAVEDLNNQYKILAQDLNNF